MGLDPIKEGLIEELRDLYPDPDNLPDELSVASLITFSNDAIIRMRACVMAYIDQTD